MPTYFRAEDRANLLHSTPLSHNSMIQSVPDTPFLLQAPEAKVGITLPGVEVGLEGFP